MNWNQGTLKMRVATGKLLEVPGWDFGPVGFFRFQQSFSCGCKHLSVRVLHCESGWLISQFATERQARAFIERVAALKGWAKLQFEGIALAGMSEEFVQSLHAARNQVYLDFEDGDVITELCGKHSVEGDQQFCDSDFSQVPPKPYPDYLI